MKIYLSSTYMDLKPHRARLDRALRKAGYDVTMMEHQTARDARVEFACVGDVKSCDTYVGLFAWRHGHVPEDDNPGQLSVTEMEFAAASDMPRLTFLLDDKARWPAARKDADLTRIEALRARLKKRCSGTFRSADELAVEVLTALRVLEASSRAESLAAVREMVRAQDMGSSHLLNIRNQLHTLGEHPFVELQLGPTPWWNSRLYLVAALAQELGAVKGLVFVNEHGQYLKAAAPAEVRRRLGQRWPALDAAYAAFRKAAPTLQEAGEALWRYPMCVTQALGRPEGEARHVLSEDDILDVLGMAALAEIVDMEGKDTRFLQREILGRRSSHVALLRDDRLQWLVDRAKLADSLAHLALSGG